MTQPENNATQTPRRGRWPLIIGGVTLALVIVVVLTATLTPEIHPAYATAVRFVNAASGGDDDTAQTLLSAELQAYVAANCPDESVSACVDAYAADEWGPFLNAVFRRAQPDGRAFDVMLLATYAEGEGFSGICIYNRVEPLDDDPSEWRVTAWSGWVECDLPNAGLSDLKEPDAPNYRPAA